MCATIIAEVTRYAQGHADDMLRALNLGAGVRARNRDKSAEQG